MTQPGSAPLIPTRFSRSLIVAALVALALCAVGGALDLRQLYRAYLVACLVWLSVTLGCWAWTMLHNLTGGGWGWATRPVLEAGAATLPLMALLFVPLLSGLEQLYLWAQPDAVAADRLLQHKQPFLNVPFFMCRTVVYFCVWLGWAWLVRRSERQHRQNPGQDAEGRVQFLSGIGLLLYCLTLTFAAIDWCMSLEPHWSSVMYGAVFAAGQALSGLAFAIVATLQLDLPGRHPPPARSEMIDLGNLLMAFVMIWAYVSFFQFLIIWYSDLPDEVTWYVRRVDGGWKWAALALMLLEFCLPFALLLSRRLKCDSRRLSAVALVLLAMRWVELLWLVEPAFERQEIFVPWLDLAATVAVGVAWLMIFARQLAQSQLPAPIRLAVHGR